MGLQNADHYKQVVVIRRWSLAQVWLYFKNFLFSNLWMISSKDLCSRCFIVSEPISKFFDLFVCTAQFKNFRIEGTIVRCPVRSVIRVPNSFWYKKMLNLPNYLFPSGKFPLNFHILVLQKMHSHISLPFAWVWPVGLSISTKEILGRSLVSKSNQHFSTWMA